MHSGNVIQKHMGWQLCFACGSAGQRRHDQRLGVLISNVILQDKDGANTALFTAEMRFKVCIENITTVIFQRRGVHGISFLALCGVRTAFAF